MSRFEGSPDEIDEGVRVAREQVLPLEREMPGFAGFIGLVDRESGRAITITLWETEEAMRHSEESARLVTHLATRQAGGTRSGTEMYEVALFEI